ncbi:MAG: AtpZ/AtpI family protein [Ahrensia sp.]|nr:AtpZ/AtpI family protein [Ahrensia sp.]
MENSNQNNLQSRRAKLDAALSEKVSRRIDEIEQRSGTNAGWGLGIKISSEFIAGIIVGAGLGFVIDKFAGTSPWGMIVMLILGFGAGVLNVLRATGKVAEKSQVNNSSLTDKRSNAGNSEKK